MLCSSWHFCPVKTGVNRPLCKLWEEEEEEGPPPKKEPGVLEEMERGPNSLLPPSCCLELASLEVAGV